MLLYLPIILLLHTLQSCLLCFLKLTYYSQQSFLYTDNNYITFPIVLKMILEMIAAHG